MRATGLERDDPRPERKWMVFICLQLATVHGGLWANTPIEMPLVGRRPTSSVLIGVRLCLPTSGVLFSFPARSYVAKNRRIDDRVPSVLLPWHAEGVEA